ncbi:gelsolin-like protein 1 isoform X2 [Watersipora subatra]|uniref:gelsolin-like protein 1 isoform X2 n=1 Tax=Watersipora subatra TaxID=2589382 RepID=UPI00355AD22D
MAGLVKPKKYDWKDSNLALFGSKLEREVKKASAATEPAWEGAGQEVGLRIWRVEKFKIRDWPKDEYGNFYSGDSYIILRTYNPKPNSELLAWDLHFWIGKYSSQDEYGTAAYKTVELDTFLDDGPVQHREVMGFESEAFKSYFEKIVYMEGGVATGFRHVERGKYDPRFFLVKKVGRRTEVKQIPMRYKNVNSGDVYIMDLGLTIYQFNGRNCSKDEKYMAAAYCQQLESERGGSMTTVLEEDGTPTTHEFFEKLKVEEGDFDDDEVDGAIEGKKRMFRISDATGKMNFELISDGELSKDKLDSSDAFLIDTGKDVIVWVGKNASKAEKKSGLMYAHTFGLQASNPLASFTVMSEGQTTEKFDQCFQ